MGTETGESVGTQTQGEGVGRGGEGSSRFSVQG